MWGKRDEKLHLVTNESSVGELFEMVLHDLPSMMAHVNLKRIQHKTFEDDKNENSGKRILQIDFAMSFGCEYQNEVQSALWSRTSVLLFTAAVFFKGECKTYLICSDTQSKDKDTVFTFVNALYDEITQTDLTRNFQPEEEVIWSDCPSSEFKNKFMVKVLQLLAKKYNRKFLWKYFATSHGKGVVIDGIGGNVKRLVRQKMMSQGKGIVVQTTKNFADVASQLVKSTSISYLSAEKIKEEISAKKPWDNVLIIPGISQFHEIWCSEDGVHCRVNSLAENMFHFGLNKSNSIGEIDLQPGEWMVVAYEGTHYPGEVIEIKGLDKIDVSVMHPAGEGRRIASNGQFKLIQFHIQGKK